MEGNKNKTSRREPEGIVKPCLEGSNQAILLDVLFQYKDAGITLDELVEVVERNGFKNPIPHNVRITLFNGLCKKGYGYDKVEGRYHLLLPAGFGDPMAHKPRKG